MQSQNSSYYVSFLPFSESQKVISYCCHLLLKELQTHQMQKWPTQAAVTTINDRIHCLEHSFPNGKQEK
jgi:hypothetical protein